MTASKPDTAAHFSRQAQAYAESRTHALDADLDVVEEFAAPLPGDVCLDVATGPGHTALRMAARARFVIAADIAPGMLATTRQRAEAKGLDNVRVILTDAGALPFPQARFDLVTCRIAPHHFTDVPGFVAEVRRVLRPGGRFVLEDSQAPEEPGPAAFLEDLEKRRDPTHVHTLTGAQWLDAFAAAGLRIARRTVYAKTHDFDQWIRRTGLGEADIAAIERHVLDAPRPVRDALFDIADGRVVNLRDQKLIVRAEPAAP